MRAGSAHPFAKDANEWGIPASATKILQRYSTIGKVNIPALSQKTRQGRGTRGFNLHLRQSTVKGPVLHR
jgi:hypothetical protein